MNGIVSRTCTEVPPQDVDQNREKDPRPLEAFRPTPAYVLLGDPGSGKTTAFKAECEALGENACLITARDFLALDVDSHPEWRDKTLFIDGLDEIRAQHDAVTPFEEISGRLDALGRPRLRLSCRAADWLGANDQKHLESVSQDAKVTVLRLNPLTDRDVALILNGHPAIGDAQSFIASARERGDEGLLANPQSLNMLADAFAQDGVWPKSRLETYEKKSLLIASEHNEEHRLVGRPPVPDQLLDAAGRLCAVQLISGAAGYTLGHSQSNEGYPALDQCDYDSPEMLRTALSTKLFKGESNNRFIPVHRHFAAFLGARHLAEVINRGLPARRVLALITGEDESVVTELRACPPGSRRGARTPGRTSSSEIPSASGYTATSASSRSTRNARS